MAFSISAIPGSGNSLLDQQIGQLIQLLNSETDKDKLAADTAKKIKQLVILLQQYIIDNSVKSIDAATKATLFAQISGVLDSFKNEVLEDKKVQGILSTLEKGPSQWNEQTLSMLEELQGEVVNSQK